MSMRDTSYAALAELEASGKAASRRAQVLRCVLYATTALSRREIARRTGLEIATVCGRVNELIHDHHLRETPHLIRCPITGKRVHGVLAVREPGQPAQGDLWEAA